MNLELQNKTALVTGGSQGIGLGIATSLVAEGATVIIASRTKANISQAIDRIKSKLPDAKVFGQQLVVGDEENTRQAIGELQKVHDIDILINNVGGPPAGKVSELSLSDWDKGYQSLLRSVILLNELILPKMKEKGWGRVLNVTSTAAREWIPGLPVSATFRSGLRAWTKGLAKEVGRSGILVNNLLPGLIKTQRLEELAEKSPDFFRSIETETGVGRIGEPEELGRVAAFLCSNANTYITGTDILVDGGFTKTL